MEGKQPANVAPAGMNVTVKAERGATQKMLPSNLQIGQKATLNFFKSGRIENVEITSVKFNRGKVYYDVAIDLADEEDGYTIIEGVDSVCVEAIN